MELELIDIAIILVTGLAAGFINTLAGGGSLLSVPVLIFLGLPSAMANATNRIAVFLGAVSATSGFKSKGVSVYPYNIWLGISALAGAIIGANIAVNIRDELFNKILAVVMVIVVFNIVLGKKKNNEAEERLGQKQQIIGAIVFFFVGIYGGFIQAGVGFLIIASLRKVNMLGLTKINSIKVAVVAIYTLAAIAVFAWNGQINWLYGFILAVGNIAGAWIASRWSVGLDEKWIKGFLTLMVVALAIKLWLY